ncbi:MAG TPA: hypothetical protein VF989_10400, partial [Polyangiaceae bacterium]
MRANAAALIALTAVSLTTDLASAQNTSASQSNTPAHSAEQELLRKLYQDAKSAGDRDDWQTAYNLMLEAWQRRQASDIAVNLAYIEIELGKFRDAAEHLA